MAEVKERRVVEMEQLAEETALPEDDMAEMGGEVTEKEKPVVEMDCLVNFEGKAIVHNFQRDMKIKDHKYPMKTKTFLLIFFPHCFFFDFHFFLRCHCGFSFGFFSSLLHYSYF